MKKGIVYRTFMYFLSISLLFLMGGFPQLIAEAKDLSRPLGEMVSRGDVKYETGGNSWKKVETTPFPLFQGLKIKTEKGTSIIALANNSQVEVSQNSILSIDETDRIHLSQGSIDFRIPATVDTTIKVANVSIVRSRPLQAAKNPRSAPARDEASIGSVTLHPNGSVTVRSDQGALSIVNQERNVVATVSSKDSITIPSTVASGKDTVMVAQAGAAGGTAGTGAAGTTAAISGWAWVGIGVTAAAIAGVGVYAIDYANESSPAAVCP